MAVRAGLVNAIKATMVGFALVAGAALVAPGTAAAAPAERGTVSAPNDVGPILAPAPVQRAVWWCDWVRWRNGRGMDFSCAVQGGAIMVTIWCSDGSSYSSVVLPPGENIYLFCPVGARVTNFEIVD